MVGLVFLGAPGSGKGTQSDYIASKLGIKKISTGDLFRSQIKNKTAIGLKIKSIIDSGNLVSDDIVLDTVKNALDELKNNGFIMDGFPRTLSQAKKFDELLISFDVKQLRIIFLKVSEKILIERLTNRRICGNCGENFHLVFKKPLVKNSCDRCQGQLIQRNDDKIDEIKARFKIFNKENDSILAFYKERGLLVEVNGERDIFLIRKELDTIVAN